MSGIHHQRTGWTYDKRPRGICQGCEEPKVLDRQGLVINHRERIDGHPGLLRCTGSGHTPSRYLEEGPRLCDGCDSTDHPVTATDDGRALLCPNCMRILKDQPAPTDQ